MKKYIVTNKGAPIATVYAVSKEWAWETWKDDLTPEQVRKFRGHIPRGIGEYDSDPFEGIDIREASDK